MDAFETATEAGAHCGAGGHREHSAGHRARSSHNPPPNHHPPHHRPNAAPYRQPITTVTASASVTVAVHPAPSSNQGPPAPSYPGYTATDIAENGSTTAKDGLVCNAIRLTRPGSARPQAAENSPLLPSRCSFLL
ncbi:hypothetical protein EYF80_061719 [Liparis tanakae]|uniref:Uncharacterized protein n=1 Tax=Liparis tanakae TaxID=230148 RepID=A0A4Z2EH71_9TELE|nr:hypothetical protein EYF80_061719 [Liparis tanakae]